jgi:hypothetical protein
VKDLVKLYSIYSVAGTEGEKKICDWLCDRLEQMEKDYVRDGNTLYYFKHGNTVMLSAHLDQVATKGPAAHIYKSEDNFIYAYNKEWQRTSLGADDKNGVWIILKMLEAGHEFNWIISEAEETGCNGIKKVEDLLDKTTTDYCVVLDRRGNTDILNKGGSTNYCQALAYNLKNFWDNGYTVETGGLSDTQTICKYIESVNMSVAYFNPHCADEYTDWQRLVEIKDDIATMLEEFIHYPSKPEDYTPKPVKYNYKKTNYNDNYWRDYYNDI